MFPTHERDEGPGGLTFALEWTKDAGPYAVDGALASTAMNTQALVKMTQNKQFTYNTI